MTNTYTDQRAHEHPPPMPGLVHLHLLCRMGVWYWKVSTQRNIVCSVPGRCVLADVRPGPAHAYYEEHRNDPPIPRRTRYRDAYPTGR